MSEITARELGYVITALKQDDRLCVEIKTLERCKATIEALGAKVAAAEQRMVGDAMGDLRAENARLTEELDEAHLEGAYHPCRYLGHAFTSFNRTSPHPDECCVRCHIRYSARVPEAAKPTSCVFPRISPHD